MARDIFSSPDHFTTESIRTIWLPFIFTDTSLLHASLLTAASFFGSPPEPQQHPIDILQLKGMTISAINESLSQDPSRPVSDQTIAAVLALAQYEAFWGEPQAFNFHMGALKNMIHMRGGLGGISSSLHGLLERVVLSVDYHASRAAGSKISFDPAHFPSMIDHPALTS